MAHLKSSIASATALYKKSLAKDVKIATRILLDKPIRTLVEHQHDDDAYMNILLHAYIERL